MKLYLDQMLHCDVAAAVRTQGHDAVRASEVGQSRADDEEVLARAAVDGRILITIDKHFGDWVVLPLRSHPGVIRVRVHPTTAPNIIALLLPFLALHTQDQFKNQLVILSPHGERWHNTADD